MIYEFIYQNPPKATRSAKITSANYPDDLLAAGKAAYRAKYGTDMDEDGYTGYLMGTSDKGDPGTDADGGANGPKPSILDLIAPAYSKKVEYDPKNDTVTFHGGSDEDGRAKEIISEVFEDIDRPERYLQGEIDLIDAAYLLFPWDQFKGFMKITIMRYTLRYEHKGWLKDLDKITVYTRRLKELEVKNKEREDRNNEK